MTLNVGHAIYVVINNLHPDVYLFFQTDYRKSRGLFSDRNGKMGTADFIPPLSRQILTIAVCAEVEKGFTWNIEFTFAFKRKLPDQLHDPPIKEEDIYFPIVNS